MGEFKKLVAEEIIVNSTGDIDLGVVTEWVSDRYTWLSQEEIEQINDLAQTAIVTVEFP